MRNRILFVILSLFFSIVLLNSCKPHNDEIKNLKLWYTQPANSLVTDNSGWNDDPEWLKALPLGNGSLGLMVFGDVNQERIQLNEESMWSGSPADNDNPNAFPAIQKIRELLYKGKYKEASTLTQKTQVCKGKGSGYGNGSNVPYGSFQTLGDLWIDFNNEEDYKNYYRELDLNEAVVRVRYNQNDVNYSREIFTSYPDQVMVARFTADELRMISFECKMNRPERFSTKTENDQLIIFGSLNDGKGGNGLSYVTRLKALNKNGNVVYTDSSVIVTNADEVILLLSASTDYKLEYPSYKGRDHWKVTSDNLEKAITQDYEDLYNRHVDDYQKYYKRVNFNLTKNLNDTIPTDTRVNNFKKDKNDPHLVELMFQYGRYLLISSSRPGTLPANLQGIWSNKIQTPWNGDYHTNINVQMNYWPAEQTNLSELHLPFLKLLETISEPGAKTAKIHYNSEGWVVHPITNVWGYTAPGEGSSWGMHVSAGAWVASHIAEHYRYTLDKDFLKNMYPILKASVQFFFNWLIEDPKTGKLISGPSVSPENTFIAPDGSRCQISMAPAHDQQIIWNLFNDFILLSKELNISDDFVNKVEEAQKNLQGPKIGKDGRLLEWNQEFLEAEPGHRHISHLFAVHPGSQITMRKTPELARAAKKSLEFRIKNGGGHTGWSAAWLISQYARLQDGENAKKSLDVLLSRSVSPNLFGQHPPFQMDANFGTTAGIAEMLLASHDGEINLLPALPKEWSNGEIKGLKARGGFEVDMKWEKGILTYSRIKSFGDRECTVRYKNQVKSFSTEPGSEYFPFK